MVPAGVSSGGVGIPGTLTGKDYGAGPRDNLSASLRPESRAELMERSVHTEPSPMKARLIMRFRCAWFSRSGKVQDRGSRVHLEWA